MGLLDQIKNKDKVFHGLRPKWTPYVPHDPTPKQLAYLMLPHREAFYGGAAGGGKSDALLMGALQYVCLLYTSPSPRDRQKSRMPSSA